MLGIVFLRIKILAMNRVLIVLSCLRIRRMNPFLRGAKNKCLKKKKERKRKSPY